MLDRLRSLWCRAFGHDWRLLARGMTAPTCTIFWTADDRLDAPVRGCLTQCRRCGVAVDDVQHLGETGVVRVLRGPRS